jgi:hypothetical protein
VLVTRRHLEEPEDQDEDEEIVHRQRLLNHVASEVLEARVDSPEHGDDGAERDGQRYPDDTGQQGLARCHFVRFFVEDEQVQREKREDQAVECQPQPNLIHCS